jgi:PAS domain S-box-containing protein
MSQAENLLDVLARIKDSVVALDNNSYVITYANQAFAEVFGLETSQMIGKNIWTLLPKAAGTIIYKKVKESIEKKEVLNFEWEGIYAKKFWETTLYPSNKSITIITKDITERKTTEAALLESEERFRNIFERTPLGIAIANMEGRVIDVNQAMEQMIGYCKEELRGKRFSEFTYSGDTGLAPPLMEDLKTGSVDHFTIEQRFISKDGKSVWVNLSGSLIFGPEKEPSICIATVEDITQRKHLQNHLEEYAKDLENIIVERTKTIESASSYSRSLIEASLDPLVTINAEGKITDANKATVFVTGRSLEELVGSDFSDYFTEPEKAKMGYKRVFTEGLVRDYPLEIKHKSGKITEVMYNAVIYRDKAGENQGVFAAARDVTELKKAEEEARESAKKLRAAERLAAIGATAAMVGHDIRNPLQAIIGDVYLLKSELTSTPDCEQKDRVKDSLDGIENNIEYINKIVADLQDYARPLNPHFVKIELKTIINELLTTKGLPENIKTNVKVESEAQKVLSDFTFIKRILYNLVNNAVQAMPNGGDLSICVFGDGQADEVNIAVKDTGVGIPQDAVGKLFTPMFTTKSKGQGFGLSVVKRMTEALGGTVTFESQEGKGTTFMVHLPQKNNP